MPDAQVQIGQVTLTSSQTSVSFTNLPQIYGDLLLVMTFQNYTASAYPGIRLNGDSASNYSRAGMRGNGSTAAAYSVAAESAAFADGPSANLMIQVNVFDYTAVDKHKSMLTRGVSASDTTTLVANRWASTAAVTSITITTTNTDTYGSGSIFTLYGVLA